MTIRLPADLFLIPFVILLAYWPSLNGPFIFDDIDSVLGQSLVMNGDWRKTLRVPWRPLTQTSFALQAIWPKTARGFHIVNWLLHAENALIIDVILRMLGAPPSHALLLAVLYAVHPFSANTVAYISGRGSLLSAMFGFLGILSILSGMWPLAVPCLLLSFLAKEDGAVFAGTFAAVQWWTGSGWFWIWAFPMLPFIYSRWTYFQWVLKNNGASNMTRGGLPGAHPRIGHALTVWVETLLHLPLWFLGLHQSPYHGSGIDVPGKRRQCLAGAVFFGGILIYMFVPAVRLPLILIAVAPWLAFLATPIPDQLIEYRYYACGVAIPLMLSGLPNWALFVLFIPAVIQTFHHAFAWSSRTAHWSRSLGYGRGDKSRALHELSVEWNDLKDMAKAEEFCLKALALNPNLAPAMKHLCLIRMAQNRPDEAVAILEECTRRCPEHAEGWEQLGAVFESLGKPDEAMDSFRQALLLRPKLEYSRTHLGIQLFYKEQFTEALAEFQMVNARRPSNEIRWNISCALREMGREEEARASMQGMPSELQVTTDMVLPRNNKAKLVLH